MFSYMWVLIGYIRDVEIIVWGKYDSFCVVELINNDL